MTNCHYCSHAQNVTLQSLWCWTGIFVWCFFRALEYTWCWLLVNEETLTNTDEQRGFWTSEPAKSLFVHEALIRKILEHWQVALLVQHGRRCTIESSPISLPKCTFVSVEPIWWINPLPLTPSVSKVQNSMCENIWKNWCSGRKHNLYYGIHRSDEFNCPVAQVKTFQNAQRTNL